MRDGAQESSQFRIEMLAERPEGIMVVVICDSDLHLNQEIKVKVKVALWGFFNTAAVRPIVFLPQTSSRIHLQRCHASYRCTRPLSAKAGTITNEFCGKSVIHENPLGSFTCRKAGTWDILFYFPSERRHTEDFSDAWKIQRLLPGLNPRTLVPVASMLTTRPPKPSCGASQSAVRRRWLSLCTVWPFSGDFSFGKSRKSQGAKSGTQGCWQTWVMWCFAKNACLRAVEWAGSVSWWSWSACSVIVNVMVTQYTSSVNSVSLPTD